MKIVYILEFKRWTGGDEGFLEVKDAEANLNKQHNSIIGALKIAAFEWEFEKINFVVSNRGPVVEWTSTPSSKSLIHKKEKKTSSSPIM